MRTRARSRRRRSARRSRGRPMTLSSARPTRRAGHRQHRERKAKTPSWTVRTKRSLMPSTTGSFVRIERPKSRRGAPAHPGTGRRTESSRWYSARMAAIVSGVDGRAPRRICSGLPGARSSRLKTTNEMQDERARRARPSRRANVARGDPAPHAGRPGSAPGGEAGGRARHRPVSAGRDLERPRRVQVPRAEALVLQLRSHRHGDVLVPDRDSTARRRRRVGAPP